MISEQTKRIIKACAASIAASILFFAIRNEWILINSSGDYRHTAPSLSSPLMGKKTITFWFWNNTKWHTEKQELLWSPTDMAHNCTYLVTHWLALLHDEEIATKRTELQSCLVNESSIYISFDRNPLPKQKSTYDKLLFIEGLLKTIRQNGISLNAVNFLVHHQPLSDTHLDFSNPWPLNGFLE